MRVLALRELSPSFVEESFTRLEPEGPAVTIFDTSQHYTLRVFESGGFLPRIAAELLQVSPISSSPTPRSEP